MLIEMNRFLTKNEIERLYQIPPDVLPTVMRSVPVVHRAEDGDPVFVESDVDRAVDAFAASATGRQRATADLAPKGRPGRKNTTSDIAQFANDLKEQGKVWKDIFPACRSRFPGRVKSLEQVRTIWRRQFGGKK